jgi:hypothetical protein
MGAQPRDFHTLDEIDFGGTGKVCLVQRLGKIL